MTDHIYGRSNLMTGKSRPHMCIKELQLYLEYLEKELKDNREMDKKELKNQQKFCENLLKEIDYYKQLQLDHSFPLPF